MLCYTCKERERVNASYCAQCRNAKRLSEYHRKKALGMKCRTEYDEVALRMLKLGIPLGKRKELEAIAREWGIIE